MTGEIRTDACGQGHLAGGFTERADLARRYDELIASAGGDVPLKEFWTLGKRLFQTLPAECQRPDFTGAKEPRSGQRL